ncbi:HEAT repeat domain-containing protein [Pontiellaceae bacterium B12227]|nr:HEAT repeat domain-containing protein [Pontiellaceae bacterium B12227]
MKISHFIRIALGSCLALSLVSCETEPDDIAKWKAEGNTGKLVKTLTDSRQFMRLDAINALAELKDETSVDPLGALVQDPDVVIVHKAIDALAAIGTPSTEKYMLQAITLPTNPARLTAAKALGSLKSTQAVDLLAQALNDEYENIAAAAAASLGQIGDPKAIPALAETVTKGSVRLRGASAASIRAIGGADAIEPLTAAMADISIKVRNEAIAGLIEAGDAAEPVALKALSSHNDYDRECALSILKGIGKIPTTGNNAVWYQLASLSIGENPKIQREEARKLAAIDNGLDALVAAAAHPSEAIREHAFQALETVGEPAAGPLAAAVSSANPDAAKWFNGRSEWAGAPAWQLDLWGAATALNPTFELDKREARLLVSDGDTTADMLRSKEFRPTRELIPLLINHMATSASEDIKVVKAADGRRELAFRKLRAYKQRSKFPLMAAVYDDDFQIAAFAAKILVTYDDDVRTKEAVIESFAQRVESGEKVSGTALHDAMLELNDPEVDTLLLKIRPNPAEAVRTLERKFPGTRVSNIPLPPPNKVIPAEPFRLKYIVNGRTRELKVVFRPNEDGDWVPNPPLPDELP